MSPPAGDAPRSRLPAILLGTVATLVTIACLGLGIWQLERRVWKLDLIARVEARSTAPAIPPPPPAEWARMDPREVEYRHVAISGRFRHDRETLVQAVTEHGPGFWVLTPLDTDDGFTLLVNRGFVPLDRRDPATRMAGNAEGARRITGLLRITEPDGAFLRSNDPAAGRWYSRDVAAILKARGIERGAPYFVDADATPDPGGLPIGGLTVLAFRNAHLIYALTWFGLSLMGAVALAFLIRQERGRKGGPRF